MTEPSSCVWRDNEARELLAGDLAAARCWSQDALSALNPVSDHLGVAWTGGTAREAFGYALADQKTTLVSVCDEVEAAIQAARDREPPQLCEPV